MRLFSTMGLVEKDKLIYSYGSNINTNFNIYSVPFTCPSIVVTVNLLMVIQKLS